MQQLFGGNGTANIGESSIGWELTGATPSFKHAWLVA